MIRREAVQELINESCDLLERTEVFEPAEPEPEPNELVRLRSMSGAWRPPPDPQPPPRQRSTVATVQRNWETVIDARANDVVLGQFLEGGKLGEAYRQAIAEALVIEGKRVKRALAIEIEALRRELADARAQIEALQTNKITSWSIDRRQYRATPFIGSTPGTTLDLRELFEQFRFDTSD